MAVVDTVDTVDVENVVDFVVVVAVVVDAVVGTWLTLASQDQDSSGVADQRQRDAQRRVPPCLSGSDGAVPHHSVLDPHDGLMGQVASSARQAVGDNVEGEGEREEGETGVAE